MSTLADELLQDFEDSDSENDQGDQDPLLSSSAGGSKSDNGGEMVLDDAEEGGDGHEEESDDEKMDGLEAEEDSVAQVEKMELGKVTDVRKVTTVMDRLEPLLKDIAHYQSRPLATETARIGNIEDNPEYKILTQSNTLSTEIDTEIVKVHKFIRDHYSARFPELETLISNPVSYAKVVAILGNGPMHSDNVKALQASTANLVGESLKEVLDGPSLMVVTVEATTTKGHEVSPVELDRILQACRIMIAMDKAKKTLTDYVQSRMNMFAPNLTAIVGSLTAAQLINAAGGLTSLSRTPACNLPSWGSKRQANTAFATNVAIRQQGFLYHSPIIRDIPNDLKKKAMKAVAAKLVLASRADAGHMNPDGSYGYDLRSQCLERLDKMTEPPPSKGQRALPAPDDKPSRKRGGRRARKAKEATAMTDLRKEQNRMAFGKEEKEVGYGTGESTAGMGMMGQSNNGRIRALQIDNRTRAKLSQKHKGWGGATSISGSASSLRGLGPSDHIDLGGKGLRTSGVGSTIGAGTGTASSLAFAPAQGLELVDPKVQAELSRKRKAEEDRWFKGGTFTQVASGTNGGFRVPDLPPPNKKVASGTGKT